jgi:cell division protease FtsH
VRCLKEGLWLLEAQNRRFAVFLEPFDFMHRAFGNVGIRFQVATPNDEAGSKITQQFFRHLERSVEEARSYRGKILSLEQEAHGFSGTSTGIKVHKLRAVERDQVILPRQTLDLLDRNVIQFARQRPQLSKLGLSTKKGILFYGPPGVGKTHTLHYLAGALPGTTTLLIAAEQVGLLGEYMTLARLLQPSMVLIEDADLIARERTTMQSVCEEVLLNKLLNEMDGLKADADVLFILTTNRPEALEAALAARPGRVDQAIEFPLPDAEGRAKLVRLYSCGLVVPDIVIEETVKKTENVSGAFIKELMRRSAQFLIERGGSDEISLDNVNQALEELLFSGGSLNRKLLGGSTVPDVP